MDKHRCALGAQSLREAQLRRPRQAQSGSVLIISLLFLLVLTLIGITSMHGTSLEEKMAGNTRGGTLALQAADPRYLIEYLDYDPNGNVVDANERAHRIGPHFYRVTAAGFGPQSTTQRVLQSTVRTWKN